MLYFDALDTSCKNPSGAVKCGHKIEIAVRAKESVKGVFLWLKKSDGAKWKLFMKPAEDDNCRFSVEFTLSKRGIYHYQFEAHTACGIRYFACGRRQSAEIGSETLFQLSVYDEENECGCFNGGVIYHIFVDRFFSAGETLPLPQNAVRKQWGETPEYRPQNGKVLNNDFFGGNLNGITEKLDYLKSLNVSAVYLSPVLEADSNHKYNTGDLMTVDKGLGGESALKRLIAASKQKSIKIILDGVFNHVGDNSVYFNKYGNYSGVGAYQSTDSPYADWFRFFDFPDKYESWWGIDTLPQINEHSESYQRFADAALEKWFSWGIDGVRLDVVDELPDDFLDRLCAKIKSIGKNKFIIGEVWEDASNKTSYGILRRYFAGGQLDSVMNYPLRNAVLDFVLNGNAERLADTVSQQINNYPKFVLDNLMNVLSTHDTERLLTAASGKIVHGKHNQAAFCLDQELRAQAVEKAKLCAILQYTLYGIPSLFYGDEAGLEGFRDPFCRACYPWGNEDTDLLSFYRELGKLRKEPVFKNAPVSIIQAHDGCFAFCRKENGQAVFVAANAGNRAIQVNFEEKTTDFFTKQGFEEIVNIPPKGFVVGLNGK